MRSRLALAGAGLVLAGCYPDPIETLADTELVITRFDPGVFGEDATENPGFRTYARPDVVLELDPDAEEPPVDPEPGRFDDAVFATLDANLEALGFERLTGDDAENADVFVLAAATAEEWEAWGCYPGWYYWGWWDGWGSPARPDTGWCFPGSASVVTFENGTLLIDMVDADVLDGAPDTVSVAWSVSINGLLSRTTEGIERQIARTIDRAFAQSNYLRVRSAP
jgi:hypothetical protein